MDSLIIQETQDTPEVNLNMQEGTFYLKSRSLPEDAMGFYQSLIDWLKEYAKTPNEETVFEFKLEYFNTSSAKQIAKIFLILESISENNKVLIKWNYNKVDLDMKLSGERFSKLLKLNFQFIEVG